MSAWAASVNAVLDAYAPFSWVVSGLAGVLIVVWTFAGAAWFRAQIYRATVMKRWSDDGDRINPLDDNFSKARIKVGNLAPPVNRMVQGKTFRSCELIGPDVAVFTGCFFDSFNGSNNDFAVIKSSWSSNNIVIFQNCQFIDCKFYLLVMFFGERNAREMSNVPWITYRPNQSEDQPPMQQEPEGGSQP